MRRRALAFLGSVPLIAILVDAGTDRLATLTAEQLARVLYGLVLLDFAFATAALFSLALAAVAGDDTELAAEISTWWERRFPS